MNEQVAVAKSIVRLLDDEPAESSSFKSHQDVADAIYDMITHEPQGRTVGLFGSWGSGKSTVIKLLSNRLKKHNIEDGVERIEIFTFDAWLHGTDPLRRSFIEKLLEFYHPEFLNKEDEKYTGIIDQITRRKEDQTLKETPRIAFPASTKSVRITPHFI